MCQRTAVVMAVAVARGCGETSEVGAGAKSLMFYKQAYLFSLSASKGNAAAALTIQPLRRWINQSNLLLRKLRACAQFHFD